jgi:DUF2934 family protein
MITELEHRIRERAHTIWEREGRPADRAEVHWSLAIAEIAAEAPKPAAPTPAAAKKAPAKPRAKVAAAAAPKVEKAEKAEKAPKAKPAPKPTAAKA